MYSAEINRRQPALLLLMIDQSFSMSEPWAQAGGSKAKALAQAVNNLLGTAVVLCSKGSDRIYNYFEIGVIGYGAGVQPVLHGSDSTRPILPIEEVAENPRRVDQVTRRVPDGAGSLVDTTHNMPVWVDPLTDGATPMTAAFTTVEPIVATWCKAHPDSFPPIVINVTDGMSTDGDPSDVAQRIRAMETADGAALVFNVHLSGVPSQPVMFPATDSGLLDPNAHLLFEMSSQLPPAMLEAAAAMGYRVQGQARGFLYNAEMAGVIDFLNIGTRAVTPTGLKEITDGAVDQDNEVDRDDDGGTAGLTARQ